MTDMKKKFKNIIFIASLLFFMTSVLLAGYKIYSINQNYSQSNNSYANLKEFVEIPESEHIENKDAEEKTTAKLTYLSLVGQAYTMHITSSYNNEYS